MMASYSLDDIINIVFAIIIVGYSLLSILGGIFSSKKRNPRPIEEDEDEEQEEEVRPRPLPRPPSPPQPTAIKKAATPAQEKFEFHSSLENFQQKSSIEDQKLTIHLRPSEELVSESLRMLYSEGAVYKKKPKQTISQQIKNLPEKKLLLLSYEVFHLPVSRRESPFPWNK